jgi:hypothetical protein
VFIVCHHCDAPYPPRLSFLGVRLDCHGSRDLGRIAASFQITTGVATRRTASYRTKRESLRPHESCGLVGVVSFSLGYILSHRDILSSVTVDKDWERPVDVSALFSATRRLTRNASDNYIPAQVIIILPSDLDIQSVARDSAFQPPITETGKEWTRDLAT